MLPRPKLATLLLTQPWKHTYWFPVRPNTEQGLQQIKLKTFALAGWRL
ncbi:hypothetical protein MPLB_1870083 [Mesorhizobium sp. ORS 3324]|nr:hypothetical protein MPLB_1870083 [Mesorhizobium sp. ORS 3324]